MITIKQKGDFHKLTRYFVKTKKLASTVELKKYAEKGLYALVSATPVDTGRTAASWYYTIKKEDGMVAIEYRNSNIQNGVPIAIIIQYGHATKNGYFVQGVDYINPALNSVFNEMASEVWKEVTTG